MSRGSHTDGIPFPENLVQGETSNFYPAENFLYKMGGRKALTSMSFCSERLFVCMFMYFKTD